MDVVNKYLNFKLIFSDEDDLEVDTNIDDDWASSKDENDEPLQGMFFYL